MHFLLFVKIDLVATLEK